MRTYITVNSVTYEVDLRKGVVYVPASHSCERCHAEWDGDVEIPIEEVLELASRLREVMEPCGKVVMKG